MLSTIATSDALLQGCHGKCLYDRASRPGLYHLHLAEDLLLAGLRRRLLAGLDPAEARESEDAVLLDFLGGDCGDAREHLACNGCLELALLRNGLRDATLGEGLAGRPRRGLHGLGGRLQSLHGSHAAQWRGVYSGWGLQE